MKIHKWQLEREGRARVQRSRASEPLIEKALEAMIEAMRIRAIPNRFLYAKTEQLCDVNRYHNLRNRNWAALDDRARYMGEPNNAVKGGWYEYGLTEEVLRGEES